MIFGSRYPHACGHHGAGARSRTSMGECQIRYKDIGDYLSREEKLRIIRESGSFAGISDWQRSHTGQTQRLAGSAGAGVSKRFMPLANQEPERY